ncbi:MAG: hypothetical protein V4439_01020 [Patescibacteria group bacterium]
MSKSQEQPEFKINELRIISEAVNQSKDYAKSYSDDKVKNINWLMAGVVIVCLLGFLQLIIDSFHINSATYKEYSQKTEEIETTQKINKELLDKNIKNQEIIIDLLRKQSFKE